MLITARERLVFPSNCALMDATIIIDGEVLIPYWKSERKDEVKGLKHTSDHHILHERMKTCCLEFSFQWLFKYFWIWIESYQCHVTEKWDWFQLPQLAMVILLLVFFLLLLSKPTFLWICTLSLLCHWGHLLPPTDRLHLPSFLSLSFSCGLRYISTFLKSVTCTYSKL